MSQAVWDGVYYKAPLHRLGVLQHTNKGNLTRTPYLCYAHSMDALGADEDKIEKLNISYPLMEIMKDKIVALRSDLSYYELVEKSPAHKALDDYVRKYNDDLKLLRHVESSIISGKKAE